MHYGHKLLEINDEENLKKENITIEYTSKDFNDTLEKMKNLKDKIEKEIVKIDELFDKVYSEVEKSYEKKHELLNIEEKNMKEKLENEVTKIKEKLEKQLSESSQIIRENERIMKGIKSMEKEDKKMIKILSYVSKINKNKKAIKLLFSQLMKNLNISYQEKDNYIKYEDYYFNGIYVPKDIQFNKIKADCFNVSWKIDYFKIQNIDNNKLSFKAEIREENNNGLFKPIYEGNKMDFTVNKLKEETNYELRICTSYEGLESPWSEIIKIKTSYFDDFLSEKPVKNIVKQISEKNEEGDWKEILAKHEYENFLNSHQNMINLSKMLKLGVPVQSVEKKAKLSGFDMNLFNEMVQLATKAGVIIN